MSEISVVERRSYCTIARNVRQRWQGWRIMLRKVMSSPLRVWPDCVQARHTLWILHFQVNHTYIRLSFTTSPADPKGICSRRERLLRRLHGRVERGCGGADASGRRAHVSVLRSLALLDALRLLVDVKHLLRGRRVELEDLLAPRRRDGARVILSIQSKPLKSAHGQRVECE